MSLLQSFLRLVVFSGAISLSTLVQAECKSTLFVDRFEAPQNYFWEVSVEVSQLGENDPGRSLTVSLNGGDPLTISGNGLFCFAVATPGMQPYSVQIIGQPDLGNVCALTNSTGIATAPVLVTATCDVEPTLWGEFNWNQANWN